MINNDDSIVLVKDSIECMTRKNVIAQISVDDINSIDRLLSGIYGRNIAEDGSVYSQMKSILRSWLTFCGILVNTVVLGK